MLRRNNHIGCTKQCIRTCCINAELLILVLEGKVYLSTLRTADPVLLGNLYLLNIIHIIQILNELVCIFCDL